MGNDNAVLNTDRELWRKGDGDGNGMSYYEPTISVTVQGLIQIEVGGHSIGLPVEEWHRLAEKYLNEIKGESEQPKKGKE